MNHDEGYGTRLTKHAPSTSQPQPQIIALHGPAGSGKSYVAAILVLRYGFRRVKFADPLKDMLRQHLRHQGAHKQAIEDMIEGDLKETGSPYLGGATPRQAMQGLGTWGRDLNEDFWVNPAMHIAKVLVLSGKSVVIDDCRYKNEAAAVLAEGGRVVLVGHREATRNPGEHVSEHPLPLEMLTDSTRWYTRGENFDTEAARRLIARDFT